MERTPPTEAHSLSRDGSRRDLSGNGNNPTDGGALTSWRRQRDGLSQEMEIIQPRKAHSRPEDDRGRDLSGNGKRTSMLGALTNWRRQWRGLSGNEKKLTGHGALTS